MAMKIKKSSNFGQNILENFQKKNEGWPIGFSNEKIGGNICLHFLKYLIV